MKKVNKNEWDDVSDWPFEMALEKLEGVVQALESGELSLDDAIEKYRLGMQLAKLCRAKLAAAEQKVELVLADEKGIEFESFGIEEV